MKSARRGKSTSVVEVTHVSEHGVWLFIDGREIFMPFELFPWFREASIGALMNVELVGRGHLFWPDLDVDLAVDSIEHPEDFPLVSLVLPNPTVRPSAVRRRRKSVRRTRADRG